MDYSMTLTQPVSFSLNELSILDMGDVDVSITHSLTSYNAIQQAKESFMVFRTILEKKWLPEHIRHQLRQIKRERYTRVAHYINKLELDNKDARTRGMSYQQRNELFSDKIKRAKKYIKTLKEDGISLNNKKFSVRSMVRPSDMFFIQDHGFEMFLKVFYS